MAKISWDQTGDRHFETGVDRAVLYPRNSEGVVWNGIISIEENVSGGDSQPYYFDGIKYLDEIQSEDFQATLEAFTYPEEFNACESNVPLATGLLAGLQTREIFGLSYRTRLGNDVTGVDLGYRLHMIYNLTAEPSSNSYQSIGETLEPSTFQWTINAKPVMPGSEFNEWGSDPGEWVWPEGFAMVGWPMGPDGDTPVPGWRATAYIWVDSNKVDPLVLDDLEKRLYGTDPADFPGFEVDTYGTPAFLPSQFDVMNVLSGFGADIPYGLGLGGSIGGSISPFTYPFGPWTNPGVQVATVSMPDVDGWHRSQDHDLVSWSGNLVAAIFHSDLVEDEESTNGEPYVRMLSVNQDTGYVNMGKPFKVGEPSDDGFPHSTIKLGDLLVHWRARTEDLYTLRYDEETESWTHACAMVADPFDHLGVGVMGYGGRLIPWGEDTILLAGQLDGSPTINKAMFAHWNGTGWDFGAVNSSTGLDVNSSYGNIAAILASDDSPRAISQTVWVDGMYKVISGNYPTAPVVTTSTTVSGPTGFYNREFFSISDDVIARATPLNPGTLTPWTGGSVSYENPFDWGVMPLTLTGETVTEGTIISIGLADDWYDIAIDGNSLVDLAVVWSLTGSQEVTALGVWRTGNDPIVVDKSSFDTSGPDDGDHGIITNDTSYRPIVLVGDWILTGWCSYSNNIFQVQAFRLENETP